MYHIILTPQGDGITKVRISYTTTHRESYFTYEQMCADASAAYAARNPHMKKEG